jgi:hypothetical protein
MESIIVKNGDAVKDLTADIAISDDAAANPEIRRSCHKPGLSRVARRRMIRHSRLKPLKIAVFCGLWDNLPWVWPGRSSSRALFYARHLT